MLRLVVVDVISKFLNNKIWSRGEGGGTKFVNIANNCHKTIMSFKSFLTN